MSVLAYVKRNRYNIISENNKSIRKIDIDFSLNLIYNHRYKTFGGMKMTQSKVYTEIRNFLNDIPVIDTHEHFDGETQKLDDAIRFFNSTYYFADHTNQLTSLRHPPEGSNTDKFRAVYNKVKHTAYAKTLPMVVSELYGLEPDMSDEMLNRLTELRRQKPDDYYENIIKKCNIKASIVHLKGPAYDITPFFDMISGKRKKVENCYYTIPISPYCDLSSGDDIHFRSQGLGREIECLDDYIEAVDKYVAECVSAGAIAFKDYTAYYRKLDYKTVEKAVASQAFDRMLTASAADVIADDKTALCDYLSNHFFELAGKYNLPVQIHTGHLAGHYNDIRNANIVNMTEMFSRHRNTRFDLFHINWPYMDEALYLGKAYPNVVLNMCWTHVIDPEYSKEFLKRAIMTMPHSHIFAFGGDTRQPEWIYAHLEMTKDNVAYALAELIDIGWIDVNDAKQIAIDIFYNNPNEFYSLGLPAAGV